MNAPAKTLVGSTTELYLLQNYDSYHKKEYKLTSTT